MIFIVFLSCIALGAVVGFLAGLLGIGGGLIVVPALVYLLPQLGVNETVVMPLALGTSLAAIVITSSSAALAHHKNNNIPWHLAKPLMMLVAIGALMGAFIADALSTQALKTFFASVVILLATYMLLSISSQKERELPSKLVLQGISWLTGIIASLMGMAGGAILVPALSYFGMPLRHSIGIATACGVLVALFGSLGYIITGLSQDALPQWSLGYIYLPALLGVIISSSMLAPLGVKFASKLPVKTLKKCFAVFLIFVAIEMIAS
ncbi:sulfite exporter TauE/SafE family protein [Litorilituus sediminis]|uniref:Probable membrane transporter protein n=1 Tax=Litorilituus sediminis TaxID=718192 RepID=A0A4V0ZGJ4_9GAMM|nr:sulfite exporter TauE/SafE family protein [Litorilituus sediminis]QBG37510.1 sulfite exporter TauE/SafE family protein [Litorilituus sediminis]